MGKHTPRPWKCDKHGIITGGVGFLTSIGETCLAKWIKAQNHARAVATTAGITSDLGVCADMVEQSKANGSLMAAAPDLLEALRGAVETAEQESMQDAWWYATARAAIAKAEGAADEEAVS